MAVNLAGQLRAIMPALPPPIAAVVGAAALALGVAGVLDTFVRRALDSNNADRARDAQDAATLIGSITRTPEFADASTRQALDVADAGAESTGAAAAMVAETRAVISYPAFANRESADAWHAHYAALYGQGALPQGEYARVYQHYVAEAGRLANVRTVPAGAVTTPVPLPGTGAIDLSPLAQVLAVLGPSIVQGLNGGSLGSLPGVLAGTGTGSLAAALSASQTASAGRNAHNAQMARYDCQGSFAGPLGAIAQRFLPLGLAGASLVISDQAKDLIASQLQAFISSQLDPTRFAAPAGTGDPQALAAQRLAEAVGFGIKAHAWATSMEAMTPLKEMGFGQFGAWLSDLAGFQRIAQGVMGTTEDAAIVTPLRWEANRRFRPTIPSAAQLELMFSKRSLTIEELADFEERLGVPDMVIERLGEFLYKDPTLGEIVRVGQLAPIVPKTFTPGEEAILARAGVKSDDPQRGVKLLIAAAGYPPAAVELFPLAIQMGLVRREQTLRYDAVTRLYRDGFMDRARAVREIDLAMTPASVQEFRLAAMDLQVEHRRKLAQRSIVLKALGKGYIVEAEARAGLGELGMDKAGLDLALLGAQLGVAPETGDGGAETADLSFAEFAEAA